MYKWQTIFNDFHRSQMTIGEIEQAIKNETWAYNNDYSHAQRRYEDKHHKLTKTEKKPF